MRIEINVTIIDGKYCTLADRALVISGVQNADSINEYAFAASQSVQAALRDIATQLGADNKPAPETID
jgi:hypothetical protein